MAPIDWCAVAGELAVRYSLRPARPNPTVLATPVCTFARRWNTQRLAATARLRKTERQAPTMSARTLNPWGLTPANVTFMVPGLSTCGP